MTLINFTIITSIVPEYAIFIDLKIIWFFVFFLVITKQNSNLSKIIIWTMQILAVYASFLCVRTYGCACCFCWSAVGPCNFGSVLYTLERFVSAAIVRCFDIIFLYPHIQFTGYKRPASFGNFLLIRGPNTSNKVSFLNLDTIET